MKPILIRTALGEALREERVDAGMTLRQVAASARVSLGYLSEVERGQKEASSELVAAICGALGVSLSELMASVTSKMTRWERPDLAAVA